MNSLVTRHRRALVVAAATAAVAIVLSAPLARAQDKVLNLYSARHYQTDEALYADFTKATGSSLESALSSSR